MPPLETTSSPTSLAPNSTDLSDQALLPDVLAAVEAAGARLLERFRPIAGPLTFDQIAGTIHDGDAQSLGVLRPLLTAARPGVGWVDDELADGALPAGDWWVTDPIEGAINYVHGMDEWAVTATLVRDNVPVLTVVTLPIAGTTYTAVRGQGAFQDGARLRVSAKQELSAALVGTGQASPRETSATFAQISRSVGAMLESAGVLRVSVPATLQLVQVAAGRMDVFWQHSAVRSGLLAGALLVAEAGGTVTDLQGGPWSLASHDFLAAAPGLHTAAVTVLA